MLSACLCYVILRLLYRNNLFRASPSASFVDDPEDCFPGLKSSDGVLRGSLGHIRGLPLFGDNPTAINVGANRYVRLS